MSQFDIDYIMRKCNKERMFYRRGNPVIQNNEKISRFGGKMRAGKNVLTKGKNGVVMPWNKIEISSLVSARVLNLYL